jgi:hypothetical protein
MRLEALAAHHRDCDAFQAAPEATDPARNSDSDISHIRFAPVCAEAHPVTGIAIAIVSR